MNTTVETYLRSRVVVNDNNCWLWQRGKDVDGYGYASFNGKRCKAHRLAWTAETGLPLASWFFICHRCDTPSCVNPDHLFAGTCDDNAKDCVAKGRSLTGARNGRSKLTDDDIRDIRHQYNTVASVTIVSLSAEYGVSNAMISRIVRGVAWRHVK